MTMFKKRSAIVKLFPAIGLTVLLCAISIEIVYSQKAPDLKQRVEDLEAKMKQLDPSVSETSNDTNLEQRIAILEQKMSQLLRKKGPIKAPVLNPQQEELDPKFTPRAGTTIKKSLPLEPVFVGTDYEGPRDEEIRLPVAGYMDAHFNKERRRPGQFDFHRFVLLFGHSFSSRVKFWSELELEHAFVEGGEPTGELELEQAYLDFLIKPYFNLRGGMLLTPIGIINERHEPPAFNGVERPQVETVIIPSTWFDMGFGATGDLGGGFRYRAYVMGGLDATLFNAEEGLREGRQKGFFSSVQRPAKVGRIEYVGVPNLTLGTSFYTGFAGFNLETVNPRVDIFNFDGRYRFDRFGVRGLFANNWVSQAGQLNTALERQTGVNPNVASQMRGYYLEPEVHIFPRQWRQDMAFFIRYEKFNTQHKMPLGFVPLPQFNRSAWVLGTTYRPVPDVAVKFDYIFNQNASQVVTPRDSINLGLGWWF